MIMIGLMTYKHSMNLVECTFDMAPDDILLPGYLLPIRISHVLKPVVFCILLSDVHAISMLLCTCIFRFPQFVFIATFPLFAVNVSQRQFQSLAWSSASL